MNVTQTSNVDRPRSLLIAVSVWIVFVLCGYWLYDGARPEFHAVRASAMQREYFRPQWYAGKLGESFANQTFGDGRCTFHAFSKLMFVRPAEFHRWERLQARVRLPADSYALFYFGHADSVAAHGIRVGRSSLYPSGFMTFSAMHAERTDWMDSERAILPDEDSFFDVVIARQDDAVLLTIDGHEWSRWEVPDDGHPFEISIIAGPTGLVLDEIELRGSNDQALPTIIRDDFSAVVRVPTFSSLWWPRMAIFSGALLLLIAFFLITRRVIATKHIPLLLLGVLTWFSWPILRLNSAPGNFVLLAIVQVLAAIVAWSLYRRLPDRKTDRLDAESETSHRQSPRVGGLLRFALTITVIYGGFWFVWDQSRLHEKNTENDDSAARSGIELAAARWVHVGDKYFLTDKARNFSWDSTVSLTKKGICEWVLRKYRGPDADYSSWYTVTISDDPGHLSGVYSTRQNYQVLLAPLQLENEDLRIVRVSIHLVGERLSVQINDQSPVTLLASERYIGEVSLVPIIGRLKLKSSFFREHTGGLTFLERLRNLWFILLVWAVIIIAMTIRWERTTSSHFSSLRRIAGLSLMHAPIIVLVLATVIGHRQPQVNELAAVTGVSVLLHCFLVLLARPDRRFFSFAEILVVLLCVETFLRINPLDPRLQENPLQADIPPHLYWYRAASARRWNSYIKHNMFRNGVHIAPFQRNRQKPSIRKIMCLGSSSTAGGYPQYIDTAFRDAGFTDVEVIDGGVPGTTTLHLVNFYQGCLASFKPDIVTLCLIRNDMKFLAIRDAQRTFEQETAINGRSPWQTRMYYWLNRIMLYRMYRFYVTTWFSALAMRQGPIISTAEISERNLTEAIDLHLANLRRFVETARSNQQLPILIIEPFFVSDGFDALPEERKTRTMKEIHNLCQELDVTVIDMQEIIDQHRHSLFFIDDVHHNNEGKHFIGLTLFKELQPFVDRIENRPRQRMDESLVIDEVPPPM